MLAFRAPPALIAEVEAWAKRQPDRPSRSKALRLLITMALNLSNCLEFKAAGAQLAGRLLPEWGKPRFQLNDHVLTLQLTQAYPGTGRIISINEDHAGRF
jgi:hypothetical protein